MQENAKKVPELRFKGFTDAWEQRKLEEMAEFLDYGLNAPAKVYDGINKYIRITDIDDSSREFNLNSLTSPDIELNGNENYILKNQDILFARTGASVGKSYRYRNADGLVYFAGFLIRARIKPEFDVSFLFQHTLTSKYGSFVRVTSQRSGQPGINAQEYGNFKVYIPLLSEQQKIGGLINNLDSLISLHKRKLEKITSLKSAYKQKLFPLKFLTAPNLRFSLSKSEWRNHKIKELFTERSQRSSEGELISVTINSGVIKASSLKRKDNSSEDKSNYKIVKRNDIAYNSMRMWQGASGYSPYDGILSPAYTVINPNLGTNSKFFAYYFKLPYVIQQFQKHSQGLTSDTWNLKFPALSQMSFFCPDFEEQNAIVKHLEKLDYLISIQSEKISHLEDMKKSYLQKMFI